MGQTGHRVPGSHPLYKSRGHSAPWDGPNRTYWGRHKPSWGGAGPTGEQGKHQPSSLLLLSPPHRSGEPVEPPHCPSSPPAPRRWGVCCSRKAAQSGGKGEVRLEKQQRPPSSGNPTGQRSGGPSAGSQGLGDTQRLPRAGNTGKHPDNSLLSSLLLPKSPLRKELSVTGQKTLKNFLSTYTHVLGSFSQPPGRALAWPFSVFLELGPLPSGGSASVLSAI